MTTEYTSLKNRVSPLSSVSASDQLHDQQRGFLKIKRNNHSTAKLPQSNGIRVKVEPFLGRFRQIWTCAPNTSMEILTPDFAGRLGLALKIYSKARPYVLNNNIETMPRLYKEARLGGVFQNSLKL